MKVSPPSTHKKVVIRKLDHNLIKGFVNPNGYLGDSNVEVIDREGRLLKIALEEIKGIYFVREFDGDRQRPERKTFQSRPRLSGLWVRMTFKDNEVLEGLISKDLLDLDPAGFLVTPSDVYSNNVRLFVPRNALVSVDLLSVISNGTSRRNRQPTRYFRRRAADSSGQIRLFPPTPNQSDQN